MNTGGGGVNKAAREGRWSGFVSLAFWAVHSGPYRCIAMLQLPHAIGLRHAHTRSQAAPPFVHTFAPMFTHVCTSLSAHLKSSKSISFANGSFPLSHAALKQCCAFTNVMTTTIAKLVTLITFIPNLKM